MWHPEGQEDAIVSNLAVISEMIGVNHAVKLARSCPLMAGRRVLYVPVRLKNFIHVAEIIGHEDMRLLHERLAGNQMTLGDPDSFERRQKALRMLANPCMSIARIVSETGVSRNFLYRNWC
ncbi:hypothetical protein PT277_01610 [Acetobacteraceae bacterium ESL0709]|nr:hypothetical protein [Acetobacteraceae bacterium ESL0697]MDF7677398.1 hypothetical protein [Acetobacteraceae bacterium ESL0709]